MATTFIQTTIVLGHREVGWYHFPMTAHMKCDYRKDHRKSGAEYDIPGLHVSFMHQPEAKSDKDDGLKTDEPSHCFIDCKLG